MFFIPNLSKQKWILCLIASLAFGGCSLFRAKAEVPLDEGGEFDVAAGVPQRAAFKLDTSSIPIDIGYAALTLSPSSIKFSKRAEAALAQTLNCADACEDALSQSGDDFTSEDCANVCGEGTIIVKAWLAAGDLSCDEGDLYGPFVVRLDSSGNVESVTPDSIQLTDATERAINGDSISGCIDVLSPQAGTISISAFSFEAGLF